MGQPLLAEALSMHRNRLEHQAAALAKDLTSTKVHELLTKIN